MLLAVWALCEFFLFWSHRSPDEGDLDSTALGRELCANRRGGHGKRAYPMLVVAQKKASPDEIELGGGDWLFPLFLVRRKRGFL